ncbi:MAG: 5-(carboxyamino)imidazole ribonucleotide synthase [Treponema sp.]|jgi:5-(carboxyamino)imidazole ribonucleotide synthase|nr:5-(carboxyamino)imidazole ribonucleotide synthase [Treponema sp.]
MTTLYPPGTIGVIGGGQLGLMMIYRSKKMGFRFAVLDAADAPARALSDEFIEGSLKDAAALEKLSKVSDLLTYEIEHINTDALDDLYAKGCPMYPSPKALRTIQDKLLQKQLYDKKGIPTSPFFAEEHPETFDFSGRAFPLVQKARKGGYDGKGVRVLANSNEPPMPVPSLFEDMVDIDKELAVMVARGRDGSLAIFPVTEMAFNPAHNICDTVIAPARIDEKTAAAAREIAVSVVQALDGVGIFGVELFLDKKGNVLINEVAPRPHNSGHYTMEACLTCQYEQHVRAIAGLPLGDTSLQRPAVMLNVLGEGDSSGDVRIYGFEEALKVPGLSPHMYGKVEARPYRKMAHFTVTGNTMEEALEKAEYARNILKIGGANKTGGTH